MNSRALRALPAHLRKRLCSALKTGSLPLGGTPTAFRSALGEEIPSEAMQALQAFARRGLDGRAVALWLEALDAALSSETKPDLVWSGPEVEGLFARDTRQVYEELMASAERSLWASSYAYFDGQKTFAPLARRMAEVPDLRVKLLLNIQRGRSDTSSADALVRRFADRLWKSDWPGARRPKVFYDPRSLEPDGPAGVLHAKGIVVDDEVVFVTSANFTEAALDRNIELGLLVRDHALAVSVSTYLQGLIDRGVLKPLPDQ